MKHILETLRKDFKEALSHIDFSEEYDPYSREFMKPLFLGQLYMAVKCVSDTDEVEDELEGAETYIEKFLATGDESYKGMAKDELTHAENLMKKNAVSLGETQLKSLGKVHRELSDFVEEED